MEHLTTTILTATVAGPPVPDNLAWWAISGLCGVVALLASVAWLARGQQITGLKEQITKLESAPDKVREQLEQQITYLKAEITKKDERLVAAERDAMSTLSSLTQYLENQDKDRNKDHALVLDKIQQVKEILEALEK